MAGSAAGSPELTIEERLVRITAGSLTIEGNLNLPAGGPCGGAVLPRQRQQSA